MIKFHEANTEDLSELVELFRLYREILRFDHKDRLEIRSFLEKHLIKNDSRGLIVATDNYNYYGFLAYSIVFNVECLGRFLVVENIFVDPKILAPTLGFKLVDFAIQCVGINNIIGISGETFVKDKKRRKYWKTYVSESQFNYFEQDWIRVGGLLFPNTK